MKQRLDILLTERGLAPSRKIAQAVIISGNVLVDDKVVDKTGAKVDDESQIKLKNKREHDFVSRGGQKLNCALEIFNIDVTDYIVLDAGASTGGFTDCLIRRGAKKVYAVDVGYGQLAYNLQTDERVVVIDRTNIRYMEKDRIPEPVDLAVIDLSFISLKKVLNNIANFVKSNGNIIALIKPQFEVGKENIGKGGIVKDPTEHERVIEDIKNFSIGIGLKVLGVIPSPIEGTKGNKEFLICLKNEGINS